MSAFFFSKSAMSWSKNDRSTLALFGGSQLTVMRVLPLPASSSLDPQAVGESASEEQTPNATRARRNPVLDIGGPPRTGAVGRRTGTGGRRTLKHRQQR